MASTGVQTFTAANTTALADLGWTEDVGHAHVVSNTAQFQNAGWNRARYTTTALDGANHYVQADIAVITGPDCAVTARQTNSTQTYYAAQYIEQTGGTGYRLRKYVNGTETDLDTAASGAGTKTVKLIVNGATQSMEVNGVEVNNGTDAVITGGTYCGIHGWNASKGSFDDWSAADLAGTTYEEILTSLAISAATITALQTFVNIVSDQITSASSLTDAQIYIENLLSLLESVSVVEAIQTYLATLNSVAQSVSSLTDLQTFVESLQSVAASSSSIQDFIGYVETISDLIGSISSIVDAQTYIQILNSIGTVSTSLADYQTYVETAQTVIVSSSSISDQILSANSEILLSTITSAASAVDVQAYFANLLSTLVSLSSISDKQVFIHNLQTLIQSQVSITVQQAYIHGVQDLIISSSGVTDILTSADAETLLSTILSQAGVYDYYKKPTMAETAIRFYMRPRQDFEFAKISPALILPVALGEGGLGLGPLGEGYIKCTGFRMAPHPANFIIQKKGAA